MPVLDYGNWIILWKDEDASKREGIDGARLEAIFSLEDSIAIETHDEEIELLDNIKKKMDEAVTKEDYAKAAKLRDKIDFLEKRKKYD
jgi:excinuclease UvrABC helicase subunit UvrB